MSKSLSLPQEGEKANNSEFMLKIELRRRRAWAFMTNQGFGANKKPF
jgi:hypothetical protein